MEITFWTMFNQMTGLFVLLLLGYLMNRLRLLPEQTEAVLSKLVTTVLLPALMLYTFMEECTVENLQKYGVWMLYGGAFVCISLLVAVLLPKWLAKDNEYLGKIYRYTLAFSNTGGVGNPIVLALFGTSGFFQYQLFLLLNIVTTYTWGVAQLIPANPSQRWVSSLKRLCNPTCIATVIGAVLGLTGIAAYLPEAIPTTIQNVGNCYAVVAMLLTGFVIGDYHVKEILGGWQTYVLTALRLVVIPCAFLGIMHLIHAPYMLRIMTCLVYACPCGMNTVVYPAAYEEDTRPGASLILITSTLSVVTIPCIYTLV